MAEKKRQHYVPQFYLRNFSWGEERLPIRLFNIRSGKQITAGNLKGQCYEDYFYGKDLLIENAFGTLEEAVSPLIGKIINYDRAPSRYSAEHAALLTFILLQQARTKHAADVHDEQIDKIAKALLSKDPSFDQQELEKVKIQANNATALPLRTMAECLPLVRDLQIKVAVNRTSVQFVTSDNPVAFYNQYAEERVLRSNTGLASKGLQIFFPISPHHMIILYDDSIYKVGNRKGSFVEVKAVEDVKRLNDLQWVNALNNVYFHKEQPLNEITRGYQKNQAFRSEEKAVVKESEPSLKPDGRMSSLLLMSKPEPKMNLQLCFVKQLKHMTAQEKLFGGVLVRDPLLIELHTEFLKLKEQGKYQAGEFDRFILDKRKAAQQGTSAVRQRTIFH